MVISEAPGRAEVSTLIDEGRRQLAQGLARTAAQTLHDAARAALDAADDELRLAALVEMAEALWRAPGTNAHEAMWTMLRDAVERAEIDPVLRARATEQLVRLATISRTCDEALAIVAAAELQVADVKMSPSDRRAVDTSLAAARRLALVGPTDLATRHRATRNLLASLDAASDAEQWWMAHTWLLADALEVGDRSRAEVELQACAACADETGTPFISFMTGCWTSALPILDLDTAAASEQISTAATNVDALEQDTSAVASQAGLLIWEQGEYTTAIAVLRDDVEWISDRLQLSRALLVNLLVANGQIDEAELELDRLAVDGFGDIPRNRDWMFTIARISHSVFDLGRRDLVAPLRELLAPYRDQLLWGGGMPVVCFGAIAWYTGRLALADGEVEAALTDLEAAAGLHERMGSRKWLAESNVDRAHALLIRNGHGDRDAALSLLGEASDLAERGGLAGLAARTTALQDDPPGPADGDPIFRAQDGGWIVRFSNGPFHLPDSKGLQGLHHLLGRVGVEVPAGVIVADVLGEDPVDQARARVNVTRQLRAAIGKISCYDEALAGHLAASVVTGRDCTYQPSTDSPNWGL